MKKKDQSLIEPRDVFTFGGKSYTWNEGRFRKISGKIKCSDLFYPENCSSIRVTIPTEQIKKRILRNLYLGTFNFYICSRFRIGKRRYSIIFESHVPSNIEQVELILCSSSRLTRDIKFAYISRSFRRYN